MTRTLKFVDVYLAPQVVFGLKIFEFFLTTLLLRFLFAYVKIIFAKTWCHPNLRLLLILQPASHWMAILINLVRHGLEFMKILRNDTVGLLGFLYMLGDTWLIISSGTMLPIAIERLVAASFAKKYEHFNQSIPYLAVFLYSIICGFAAYMEWILYYTEMLHVYTVYAIVGMIFSIATIIFAILPYVSRQHFAVIQRRRNTTVSERYQTGENMKAAHLLKYISAYKCVTNFLSLAFYMVAFEIDPFYLPLATEIYYYWNIIQLTCQMLLTTMAHDVLREQVLSLFKKQSTKIYSSNKDVRSITGQKLIYTQKEESEKYFEMYMDAWKVPVKEIPTPKGLPNNRISPIMAF